MSSRVKEISDLFIEKKRDGGKLNEILSRIVEEESRNSVVGVEPVRPNNTTIGSLDVYRYLTDKGAGRIFEGMRSLELLSKVISGIHLNSLHFFDNKIIAYTADDVKNSDEKTAIKIVTSNLGIEEVLLNARALNTSEVALYEEFCIRIIKRVKHGTFKTTDFINEAVIRVKALIRSVLSTRRV